MPERQEEDQVVGSAAVSSRYDGGILHFFKTSYMWSL